MFLCYLPPEQKFYIPGGKKNIQINLKYIPGLINTQYVANKLSNSNMLFFCHFYSINYSFSHVIHFLFPVLLYPILWFTMNQSENQYLIIWLSTKTVLPPIEKQGRKLHLYELKKKKNTHRNENKWNTIHTSNFNSGFDETYYSLIVKVTLETASINY